MQMLSEPPPTQVDVHFHAFGFPVRIHPFFWAIALLIGLSSFKGEPLGALLSVPLILVSILAHELGHAVLQRRFGGRPYIVLHGFGGLAICGDCDRSPRSQILISLAGPIAGFLLAGVIVILLTLVSGYVAFQPAWSDQSWASQLEPELTSRLSGVWLAIGTIWYERFSSPAINDIFRILLYVNIFWGLMNLLPVYPLDGGQVAREVMTLGPDPRQGMIWSLQLSIGVAVVVALWGLFRYGPWMAILFGLLSYNNYRTLQSYTGRGPGLGWR